ncbi:MAG: hypothetical protein ABI632_07210 [Pseudolysinimonas sp.]
MDDFLNEVTVNGKFRRCDWNKLTHSVGVQAAGEWHCLFHSTGNPTVGVLNGGTNLSFQTTDELVTGAIPHGGEVTTDTKHLVNASAFSAAATTMPAVAMLVDLLGYYPMSTTTTTGDQATIHAVTATFANATDIITHTGYDIADRTRVRFSNSGGALPTGIAAATDYWTIRQSATTSKIATTRALSIAGTALDFTTDGTGTNTITAFMARDAGGAGVQVVATCNTACGAATPNMRVTYTDSGASAGNLTPATLPAGKTSPIIGHIPYSGTGAGKYGPFMPLAAGDAGIASIQQLNLSASYVSGTLAYCLARPLLYLPMTTVGVAAERDLLNQVPSLPQVFDGACLAWLLYAGAATPVSSAFYGHLDAAWG